MANFTPVTRAMATPLHTLWNPMPFSPTSVRSAAHVSGIHPSSSAGSSDSSTAHIRSQLQWWVGTGVCMLCNYMVLSLRSLLIYYLAVVICSQESEGKAVACLPPSSTTCTKVGDRENRFTSTRTPPPKKQQHPSPPKNKCFTNNFDNR